FSETPELGLAQSTDALDPAERFLDAFADALAGGVARMPRRAPIDRRAAASGVLGHMRAHVHAAQFLDKGGGIVTAVGPESERASPVGDMLPTVERRQPFGVTRDAGQPGIDDQARAVLHQPVADETQPGLHAWPLAVEPRIGVGRALMCFVVAFLTPKIGWRIAP